MSVISAGTTTTTAFKVTGDTTGTLQLQTGAVPTTAINISATQVVTFPATTTLDFTGTLLLGDGSAAAPTLAHSGDTNTGMFFPAADTIAFTEGGVESMRLTSAGNLGIGTNNPVAFSNQTSVTVNGTNNGRFDIRVGGTHTAAFVGGGSAVELSAITNVPMTFATNSVERMRLDTSGNLGLGVTPAAWDTLLKAITVTNTAVFSGQTNSEGMRLGSNWYYSGAFRYQTSAAATRYDQASGGHSWFTAPSGTAGNAISFTQAMTLTSNGNLLLSRTSDPLTAGARLVLQGPGDTAVQITKESVVAARVMAVSTALAFGVDGGDGATERARITSGGTFCIGTTAPLSSANRALVVHFNYASASGGGEGGIEFYNSNSSTDSDVNPALSIRKGSTTTSSSQRFVQFYCSGNAMGGIVGNGATNVQFVSLSDARQKTNIQSISGSLEKILALNPVSFDWIKSGEHVKAGFVAQNVEQVFPEFVVENFDTENGEPRKGLTGGMTGGIIAHLVKAIQELSAKVAALESK